MAGHDLTIKELQYLREHRHTGFHAPWDEHDKVVKSLVGREYLMHRNGCNAHEVTLTQKARDLVDKLERQALSTNRGIIREAFEHLREDGNPLTERDDLLLKLKGMI